MQNAIQFIAALLVCSLLFWLHRHALANAYARGHTDGVAGGLAEKQQLEYHRGYSDGSYEGRLKERLEWETKAAKAQRDYDQGWADAIEAVEGATYSAMATEATIRLSA